MSTQQKQFGLRILIVALVAAVLVFGGIGLTGVAAQSSIPGDALYPIKTSIEQTRLSLAQDAGNRAQMKMGFAEERLAEVEALIAEGRFGEVDSAVLSFESYINSAILDLQVLAKADPTRASQLALEITTTLTRYAQTLSALMARVPESVRSEVNRALDTTRLVGGMDMPDDDDSNENVNDNSNSNSNENVNDADDDNSNSNMNGNVNDDDDDNSNGNVNDGDDNSNSNSNVNDDDDEDDNSNGNINGDDDDDDDNTNVNDNSNDDDDDNSNSNTNVNDDDHDDDNSNSNDNSNDNDSGDDGSNSNDNGNDNGDYGDD